MITSDNIVADLHTYITPIGYSTAWQNIRQAEKNSRKFIGIAELYDGTGDKASKEHLVRHLLNMRKIRDTVRVIPCLDINLGQSIELPYELKDIRLRYGVLSDMYWSVKHHTLADLQGIIKTHVSRGDVNVISTPEKELEYIQGGKNGTGLYTGLKEHLDWLVEYAKKNRVYLEASDESARTNEGSRREMLVYWLKRAMENNNPIILSSNAKYCGDVGKFEYLLYILNKIGYPKEYIINCNSNLIESQFIVKDPMDIMEVDSSIGFECRSEHKRSRQNTSDILSMKSHISFEDKK